MLSSREYTLFRHHYQCTNQLVFPGESYLLKYWRQYSPAHRSITSSFSMLLLGHVFVRGGDDFRSMMNEALESCWNNFNMT